MLRILFISSLLLVTSVLAQARVVPMTPEVGDEKLSATINEVTVKEQHDDIIAILIGFAVKGTASHKVTRLNLSVELNDGHGRKAQGERIVVIAENEPLPASAIVEVRVPTEFQKIVDGTSNTFTVSLAVAAQKFGLGDGSVRSVTVTAKREGKLGKQ